MNFVPLDLAAGPGRHLLRGLRPDERHLVRLITAQAELLGDRPALVVGKTTVTYAELPQLAAAGYERLVAAGVKPGDRVVTVAGNTAEALHLLLGSAVAGAVHVPLDPALGVEELRDRIADVEPVAVFTDSAAAVAGTAYQARPVAASPLLGGELPEGEYDGTLPGLILHTSGTSGRANAVVCPHSQLVSWAIFGAEQLGLTSEDVLFTNLPLFHCNALVTVLKAWVTGATVVVGDQFSVSGFWEQLTEHRATVTFLLGSMIHRLLGRSAEIPPPEGHSLRLVLAPGSGTEAKQRFTEWSGALVVDAFGMTELSVVSYEPLDRIVTGSMGVPFPDFELRVADRYDVPVPDGAVGQLLVRPRSPFTTALGYWKAPEDTLHAWRNLWFHTGDLVAWEPDGSLRYVDRAEDAIHRRDQTISSRDVEAVLQNHPAVLECAAYGVPASGSDDEIVAAVRLVPGSTATVAELAAHAEAQLTASAVPDHVLVVDELPRTAHGKIAKRILRERGTSR
jgi:crotonobetaine/carnitine-CoA ligase